jgi:hypothetical protein
MKKKYTKKEIVNELDKSKYAGRYTLYDTYLEQNETRWKYNYRLKYEEKLKADGLRYFAFIKFYLDEKGEKIGLVAGKSGSKNVIGKSDLIFSTNHEHGPARQWLIEEKKEWCQTQVLVIAANAEEDKKNEYEALQIERYLKETFNLFES